MRHTVLRGVRHTREHRPAPGAGRLFQRCGSPVTRKRLRSCCSALTARADGPTRPEFYIAHRDDASTSASSSAHFGCSPAYVLPGPYAGDGVTTASSTNTCSKRPGGSWCNASRWRARSGSGNLTRRRGTATMTPPPLARLRDAHDAWSTRRRGQGEWAARQAIGVEATDRASNRDGEAPNSLYCPGNSEE